MPDAETPLSGPTSGKSLTQSRKDAKVRKGIPDHNAVRVLTLCGSLPLHAVASNLSGRTLGFMVRKQQTPQSLGGVFIFNGQLRAATFDYKRTFRLVKT